MRTTAKQRRRLRMLERESFDVVNVRARKKGVISALVSGEAVRILPSGKVF